MSEPRTPPTAEWRPPVNADLLKRGAASPTASPGGDGRRGPTWLTRLRRRLTTLCIVLLIAIVFGIYMAGGVDPTASLLLAKETANAPGGSHLRKLALVVMAHRSSSPGTLKQLARLAHMLEPGDPLWASVVQTTSTLLGRPVPQGDRPTILAALDTAVANAVDAPLTHEGVLAWRAVDPYFVFGIEQIAGSDAAVAAQRFNSYRTPDGLPTAEWYLDELVRGFGDRRAVSFVLVADSTGDEWRPLALPPDKVPAHARRIDARTVGEALTVGLWGLDEYRPVTPETDIATWWAEVARPRGLPAFDTR